MKYKLTLPEPVELSRVQIADISERATVTINEEWLVTELENNDLYTLSSAIDTLYCYMESNGYFDEDSHYINQTDLDNEKLDFIKDNC